MFRYLIALCAVGAGAAAAVLEFVWSVSTVAPHERGVPGQPSSEVKRLIFDGCITFYGVAYATGRFLYRGLGAHDEAGLLQEWSRGHMALLHLTGGAWLVVSGLAALADPGLFRPSLIVGIALVAIAARDGRAALRFAGVGHTTLWRGRGLVAVVAGLVTLASCSGLMLWHPGAALVAGVATLLGGGLACRHWGRKWSRNQQTHTLLGMSLETWGWIYMASAAIFVLLAIVGLVKKPLVG
jgi:hypothetical protein